MRSMLFILTIAALYLCKESVSAGDLSKDVSKSRFERSPGFARDSSIPRGKYNVKPKHSTSNDVIGVWALVGEKNASFDIQKNGIIYPEDTREYKYEIIKDSIRFIYGSYKVTCKVELHGKDTLVLKGPDTNVYYRFKD